MTSMIQNPTISNQHIPVFEITIKDGEELIGKTVLEPASGKTKQVAKVKFFISSEQSEDRDSYSNRNSENLYHIGGGLSADIQQDSERSSEATVFGKNKFRKSSKNYKISTTFSKKKLEQTNNPLQKISSAVDKVFKRS